MVLYYEERVDLYSINVFIMSIERLTIKSQVGNGIY